MPLEEIDPGQLPHIYEEHHVDMTTGQQQAYDQMLEWQIMSLGDGDDDIVVGEWGMVAAMRLQQLAQAMGRIERREVHRWVIEDDPDTGQRIRVNKTITTVRVGQIEPSPKLDDMISTLLDTERQCGPTIIFTQFADMVGLACRRMDRAGLKYVSVQQNSEINRAEIAFQTGEVDIIIGTVGLISESIDLARATTEIFIDCPWNPRVRGQAEDRAREYGKRTAVRIIDIRTRDSVDFARLDRVRTKQEWKDALLGRKRLGNGDA
jgi:SNF2 family DNA or RNA helicase